MKEKRGLLIYLAGSVMLAVSVFLPYFRWHFVKEEFDLVEEYKESFPLMHGKELENYYLGLGNVSTFTHVMIYLILAAGILGVCIVMFQLLSHDDDLSIVTFGIMTTPPLLGIVANIVIRKDKFISIASDIVHNYKTNMLEQGFSGSAGYGIGYWLLITGTVMVILGLFIYLKDTQFSD